MEKRSQRGRISSRWRSLGRHCSGEDALKPKAENLELSDFTTTTRELHCPTRSRTRCLVCNDSLLGVPCDHVSFYRPKTTPPEGLASGGQRIPFCHAATGWGSARHLQGVKHNRSPADLGCVPCLMIPLATAEYKTPHGPDGALHQLGGRMWNCVGIPVPRLVF